MKRILAVLLALPLVFISCEGDQGPPGEDGFDGINAEVFEVDGVDFVYESDANLYSASFALEDYTDFEILEPDAILIYRFGEMRNIDGDLVAGWELLPAKIYADNVSFEYGFSHAFNDAEIRITSEYDIAALSNDFIQNQTFRFVIVPSNIESMADTKNMEEVLRVLNIKEINKINVRIQP